MGGKSVKSRPCFKGGALPENPRVTRLQDLWREGTLPKGKHIEITEGESLQLRSTVAYERA